MPIEQPKTDARLALMQGIMEGAFFTPVHKGDWLAYGLDQPALLGLEPEEALDVFIRAAIACEVIFPSEAEGRDPMAWLYGVKDPTPVWAHVLSSLRQHRPFLFHRALFSIPAVAQELVDPEEYELMEDFLAAALAEGEGNLRDAAANEMQAVTRRCLSAAGSTGDDSGRAEALSREVLAKPQAVDIATDAELRLWLALGDGLEGIDPDLAPAVMVEVWKKWAGTVIGAEPDVGFLARLNPQMAMSAGELALYAPPDPRAGHLITADCPYCKAKTAIKLGERVQKLSQCEHLIYMGTTDEAHIMDALEHFELGGDFSELMNSYYGSPADLNLFAAIVNDLFEMLQGQGRLSLTPVSCETQGKGFFNLRAYYKGPGLDRSQPRH